MTWKVLLSRYSTAPCSTALPWALIARRVPGLAAWPGAAAPAEGQGPGWALGALPAETSPSLNLSGQQRLHRGRDALARRAGGEAGRR